MRPRDKKPPNMEDPGDRADRAKIMAGKPPEISAPNEKTLLKSETTIIYSNEEMREREHQQFLTHLKNLVGLKGDLNNNQAVIDNAKKRWNLTNDKGMNAVQRILYKTDLNSDEEIFGMILRLPGKITPSKNEKDFFKKFINLVHLKNNGADTHAQLEQLQKNLSSRSEHPLHDKFIKETPLKTDSNAALLAVLKKILGDENKDRWRKTEALDYLKTVIKGIENEHDLQGHLTTYLDVVSNKLSPNAQETRFINATLAALKNPKDDISNLDKVIFKKTPLEIFTDFILNTRDKIMEKFTRKEKEGTSTSTKEQPTKPLHPIKQGDSTARAMTLFNPIETPLSESAYVSINELHGHSDNTNKSEYSNPGLNLPEENPYKDASSPFYTNSEVPPPPSEYDPVPSPSDYDQLPAPKAGVYEKNYFMNEIAVNETDSFETYQKSGAGEKLQDDDKILYDAIVHEQWEQAKQLIDKKTQTMIIHSTLKPK